MSNLNLESELLINENDVDYKENRISLNELIPIQIRDENFSTLMNIYKKASEQVLQVLNGVKIEYDNMFNRNIINHTTSRIKAPGSILNKMRKKDLKLDYKSLVENINDIAGVRVVCPMKNDIYTVANIIRKIPNWNLLNEKDYIKKSKRSGYSGYHIIVEVPVKISDEPDQKQIGSGINNYQNEQNGLYLKNQMFIKVEIQLRTMAMDFWATNEHRMKYKSERKLSFLDSRRLAIYAKILNLLDNQFMKISEKQSFYRE